METQIHSHAFDLLDEIIRVVINNDLRKFLSSETCCTKFSWIFNKFHRHFIHEIAKTNDLQSYIYWEAGERQVIIIKSHCRKYFQDIPVFDISDTSKIQILEFLQRNQIEKKQYFIHKDYNISKNVVSKVPLYRFCSLAVNSKPAIPKNSQSTFDWERDSMPIYKYRSLILEVVKVNRITCIVSDAGYGKSTQIPQFLLEDANEQNMHCKIFSAQKNKLSVLNYSEKVSSQRGEKLGMTVGFQIRLESVSSSATNLIFTTTEFFLRCLVGHSAGDIFSEMTHIIIDDFDEKDVFSDLLLLEIKNKLNYFPHLKLILLSSSTTNNSKIEEYVEDIYFLELEPLPKITSICYLEDIAFMKNSIVKGLQHVKSKEINAEKINNIDNILDRYMLYGNEQEFNHFLNFVQNEGFPIDVQHSQTGISALMIAASHNNVWHVQKLIELGINLDLTDNENRKALNWAQIFRSRQCEKYLKDLNRDQKEQLSSENIFSKMESQEVKFNFNSFEVDHYQLLNLIKFIHESICSMESIVVFLPRFEDLLRQKFILHNSITGGYIENVEICLLHENIDKDELNLILARKQNFQRRIILCTNIAETTINIHDVIAVIDSGLYADDEYILKHSLTLISKEKAQKRATIASRHQSSTRGYCYRLYSKKDFSEKMPESMVEANNLKNVANLQKTCLYMRLLSTSKTIKEYFRQMIEYPSEKSIDKNIDILKIIGLLDESENVTLLGSRLIDIPIDLKLGKTLIFSVIMQCLDPVLTIVSLSKHQIFFKDFDNTNNFSVGENYEENYIKSDHLILLRIFQKWQNGRSTEITSSFSSDLYQDESKFILNGILEVVYRTRTLLVGALRAIGLITSSGYRSMNSINTNSNIWALVKSCLITGMYPNICYMDRKYCVIKSKSDEILQIHRNSTLAGEFEENQNRVILNNYQSNWITYQDSHEITNNRKNILCSTIITPIMIALFCGNIQLPESSISSVKHAELNFNFGKSYPKNLKIYSTHYVIDDWIIFRLQKSDACLLYNLRKKFFDYFIDMIDICESKHNIRKKNIQLRNNEILEIISKVVLTEDLFYNFMQPNNVGEKPKAIALKFKNNLYRMPNKTCSSSLQADFPNFQENQKYLFHNMKFYVLNFGNSKIKKGFITEFSMLDTSVWKSILHQCQNSSKVEIIVFLFKNQTNTFYGTGKLSMLSNDKWYLEILSTNTVPEKMLQLCYSVASMAYENICDGYEIPFDIAKSFMKYFDM